MQILTPAVVAPYAGRIINIHPSLLPYFPGANPYRRAWEDGVRVTGCTAHFVTEELDAGPIILQDVFHIDVGVDTVEDVRKKGRALEGAVLSKAVQLYLNNEVVVIDGKVVLGPGCGHCCGILAKRSSGVADEAPGHADALDAAAVDIDDVFGAGMNDDVLVRAHAFEAIDGRCDHVRRVGKEAHGASRRAGVERCWRWRKPARRSSVAEQLALPDNNVSADVKGDGRQGGHSRL
jgi:hypothetical protein